METHTWIFGLALITGLAALWLGWRLGHLRSGTRRGLMLLALLLVLGKVVLNFHAVWEVALFPWAVYAYLQGYWLYPPGLFFFGAAFAESRRLFIRSLVGMAAVLWFLHGIGGQLWLLHPLDLKSVQRADSDHHCRQTTGFTCVPAACTGLLSWWGIDVTEGEMAGLCLTQEDGTTTFNAYRALRLKTWDSTLKADVIRLSPGTVQKLGLPVLLCDQRYHAVVIQYTNGVVRLWDPMARGVREEDWNRFAPQLHGAGVVILPKDGGG